MVGEKNLGHPFQVSGKISIQHGRYKPGDWISKFIVRHDEDPKSKFRIQDAEAEARAQVTKRWHRIAYRNIRAHISQIYEPCRLVL